MHPRSNRLTRRDFLAATTALVGSARWPVAAAAEPPLRPAPGGTVLLFQGDSVTDCGRDRAAAEPNMAGAPPHWAADGVHPTSAGHAMIAERWRRAAHL